MVDSQFSTQKLCNFLQMQLLPQLSLDRAVPMYFRSSGELLIGFTDTASSAALEIHNHPREVATWLRLFDGSRNSTEVLESGMALGIPIEYLRQLLAELMEAGHVRSIQLPQPRPAIPQIELQGAGALPASVFKLLRQSGWNPAWTPSSSNRIRQSEIDLAEMESGLLGQRWDALGVLHQSPQIILHFTDIWDVQIGNPSVPTIPIIWHQRRISIGPIINLPTGHSAHCFNAHHQRRETDWNYFLTQILHQPRALPLITYSQLQLAAANIFSICSTLSAGISPVMLEQSYELLPPAPFFQCRKLAIQDCLCVEQAA